MKKSLLLLLLLHPLNSIAQDSPLAMFEPLVNKTWYAEGKWGDGSSFKQDSQFQFSLDSTLVIVDAKGFTDKTQTQFGLRNHGVRQFDAVSQKVKFWEFDVFGGLTQGEVIAEGKNILYQYQYGETFLTDMWEYVNDSTYNFKVGVYEDGAWKQVYLETKFEEMK